MVTVHYSTFNKHSTFNIGYSWKSSICNDKPTEKDYGIYKKSNEILATWGECHQCFWATNGDDYWVNCFSLEQILNNSSLFSLRCFQKFQK